MGNLDSLQMLHERGVVVVTVYFILPVKDLVQEQKVFGKCSGTINKTRSLITVPHQHLFLKGI